MQNENRLEIVAEVHIKVSGIAINVARAHLDFAINSHLLVDSISYANPHIELIVTVIVLTMTIPLRFGQEILELKV